MTPQIVLNERQKEALALAQSKATFILFFGGSRASKTFAILFFILMRALVTPNSRHGVFRKTQRDARRKLFDLTMMEVMRLSFPATKTSSGLIQKCKINHTDMTIELPNGSIILFDGLDDRERLESVLGDEFNTIFINEVSQFNSYEPIEMLQTRLSLERVMTSGKPITNKFFMDCNPPGTKHWAHRIFVESIHPESNLPLENPEDYASLWMSPYDNQENLSANYLKILQNLSGRKRKRFLDGVWAKENDAAIFKAEWIDDAREPARSSDDTHDDLTRIIVAIDPAASSHSGSDETGIIVAGLDSAGECHVLEDCSGVYTPSEWSAKALDAYYRWQADKIVAERNNGGEMVAHTIRVADTKGRPSPSVKTVWASRDKRTRADPVADLYSQGKVHHCGSFEKLEGQLEDFTIDFNRSKNGSPDRLDALVWAITELAVEEQESRRARQGMIQGFMTS